MKGESDRLQEYSLTIASKKIPGVCWSDGFNYLSDVYAVRKKMPKNGRALESLINLSLKGYEYKVNQ